MNISISERIAASEAKLTALRARRGSALLDGEVVDAGEVAAVEAELEALQDAQGEQVRRERAVAARARGKRRGELKDVIEATERERIAAIADAEEAARALVDALKRAIKANGEIHNAVHELTGRGPVGFTPISFENRVSAYLSADMRKLKQGPRGGRLGHISWPINPPRQNEAWAVEESKFAKADLADALKGENA